LFRWSETSSSSSSSSCEAGDKVSSTLLSPYSRFFDGDPKSWKKLILKTTLYFNSAVNNHNIKSIAKGYFGIVDKPPKQNFPLSINYVISIKMMLSAVIVKI
jgi:hypothetical protein